MIQATGAQIIVKLLERQGITVAAGIPGGSILPLYHELSRSTIRHILVRHEQAAGFLAQGIARTTGKPAVCIATSGPGAVNLLTAIADARSDSVPLVAITGQVDTARIGTDAFQEVDTFGLSFPITKHSILIKHPEELLEAVPRAFEIAASGRPGPVLIDVPKDIQNATVSFDAWPEPGTKSAGAARFRTAGTDFSGKIAAAADLLRAAKKPVLYAGGGCNSPEAAAQLAQFLAAFPMPAVVSLMGIGSISATNPAFLGMVGIHGTKAANSAVHSADVVIAAGARFDDRAASQADGFCPRAKIIHIDIDAAEINKILPSDIAIVADTATVFPALTALLAKKAADTPGFCRAEKAPGAALSFRGKKQMPAAASLLASIPDLAAQAGRSPDTVIVTADVGQHQMWAARYYPFTVPRSFLTSGSLGTMGFGLPAAIGAALARPDCRILCISGDSSIMMNIQELATLAELHLDVTVLVLDNGALGLVRQQQLEQYGGVYYASIYERRPDLAAIAAGFGIPSSNTDGTLQHQDIFPPPGSGPRFICCAVPETDLA